MSNTGLFNSTLSHRICEIRCDLFGDGEPGQEAMAARLSIPWRSWANYEAGVSMPAKVLLEFLVATGADPGCLLTGDGARYLDRLPAE